VNQPQKIIIILTLGALSAIGPLSVDMYLPGFQAIAVDLQTDIARVGLSLSSYFIGISLGQLAYGPLIDRFGRKKPLLAGLVLYLLSALACALAPGIYSLIALRFLLALGGCAGMVASRAMVRDLFPAAETAKVFSTLILIMGIAPIVAPTIGAYVSAHLGWRYIFLLLLAFSGILLLMVKAFLPENRLPDPEISLKPKAILREYVQVLKDTHFTSYALVGSITYAGLFAYIAGSPFVFMEYLGFSETLYGWIFGLNAFAYIAGSQLNRLWLKRKSPAQIALRVAFYQLLAGLALIFGTIAGVLNPLSTLALLFIFIGWQGFLVPNAMALALEPFTRNVGSASALLGSFQVIAGALASVLVSALHNGDMLPMILVMAACACVGFALLFFYQQKKNKVVLSAPGG
jgi:DHA1 family bicyclomycin/chloramphenicol resistance-like MFS transporter